MTNVIERLMSTLMPRHIGVSSMDEINAVLVRAGKTPVTGLMSLSEYRRNQVLHRLYVPYLYTAYTSCQRFARLWYDYDLSLPQHSDPQRVYKVMHSNLGQLLAKIRVTKTASTEHVTCLRRLIEWTRLAAYQMHKGRFGPQVISSLMQALLVAGTAPAPPIPELARDPSEDKVEPPTRTPGNWASQL